MNKISVPKIHCCTNIKKSHRYSTCITVSAMTFMRDTSNMNLVVFRSWTSVYIVPDTIKYALRYLLFIQLAYFTRTVVPWSSQFAEEISVISEVLI
jgi:hypothetical protein